MIQSGKGPIRPGFGDHIKRYYCSPKHEEQEIVQNQFFEAIDKILQDYQIEHHFTMPISPTLSMEMIEDCTIRDRAQGVYYTARIHLYGQFIIGNYYDAPFITVESQPSPYADFALTEGLYLMYQQLSWRINREEYTMLTVIAQNSNALDEDLANSRGDHATNIILEP